MQCEKCKGEYPVYTSWYKQVCVGRVLPNGGVIRPTHGKTTFHGAMDRKAREYFAEKKKESRESVREMFHMTKEEWAEFNKKCEEDDRRRHKEYEKHEADIRAKFRDAEIDRKSQQRKELIEKGVLKYIKGIGLVNTETGEVVKL